MSYIRLYVSISNSRVSNGGLGGRAPRLASDGLGFEYGVFGKCPEALNRKERHVMLLRLIVESY